MATLVGAVEAVARGDGSSGWCVGIAATSGMLSAYLPEGAAREAFGSPRSIAGGVYAPRGRAVPDPAGGFPSTGAGRSRAGSVTATG